MKASTDRILTAIYCDDIRHEVGNKMSFMGCYQSELIVPSVPIGLSKLCIYATVMTPIARPFKSLTLRIVLDKKTELARLEIPPEGLGNGSSIPDATATRKSISSALMFSPFLIEKDAVLQVMAETEEGEIVGPRLLIKVAQNMVIAPVPEPAVELATSKVAVKKSGQKKSKAAA